MPAPQSSGVHLYLNWIRPVCDAFYLTWVSFDSITGHYVAKEGDACSDELTLAGVDLEVSFP